MPVADDTSQFSESLHKRIADVKAKRPRTVLNHILQHGYITTHELKELYGYNHPPRAVRDVRELGFTIETYRVRGPDGRRIAAYRLLDQAGVSQTGRRIFPKALKDALLARDGAVCAICGCAFPARLLQIDHRVPYAVAGDSGDLDTAHFQLL